MKTELQPVGKELWTRDFLILFFTNSLFFAGFQLLIPVIPLYVTRLGGTSGQVGLIAGIFVFSAIFIRLFTDWGIKKFGKRYCLFIGITISFLSVAGYYLWLSVGGLLAIRIIHGIGFGIATTFYATLAADIIPVSRCGEGMGYFGMGTTMAMAVAPAAGIWLMNSYGFGAVFFVSALCQIHALLGVYFCSVPAMPVADEVRSDLSRSVWDRFMVRGTRFPAFLAMLFGICYGSVLTFIAVFAKEVNIANPGYFFLLGTLCMCLSRTVTGKIFDRKGPAWVILPGAILFLAGLAILTATTTLTAILAAAVFYGFGVGALFPALQTWILNLVPASRRSAASATFYNVLDIGAGGGAIMLGLLAGATGYASVYIYSTGVMFVFLAAYSYYYVNEKKGAATAMK
ncbi:MFS transporter [Sporomusa termitida]|uniref:Multidrug resistance protein MdtG n=1 Tax=Sporomusa termitida TaxID=2377 RepID=A0A517E0M7_9FIRM|nr:MFS transporter [Sporomusa termitida]QDR83152.1 Multidrug resistance protein MdtG [Sporomusa termitida]